VYGKHFASTYTGSMCGAGAHVFAVWGYAIANLRDGHVELNTRYLAATLGMPEADVQRALDYLTAPDPNSRTSVEDGRRLIKVGTFEYRSPTHLFYRNTRNDVERRESNRLAAAVYRGKKRIILRHPVSSPESAQAEAEAEAESFKRERAPTLEEAKSFFESEHLSGSAEAFFYHFEETGWRKGNGKPVRNWKLTARKWSANETTRYAPKPNGPQTRQVASGDIRLPTGGFAAADRSWFDYKGTRFFQTATGVYRDNDGYAPDGTHKQNTNYGPAAKEIADRILAAVPK